MKMNKIKKSCTNCKFCGEVNGESIICGHPSWKKLEDQGEEIDISEKTFSEDFAEFCWDFIVNYDE